MIMLYKNRGMFKNVSAAIGKKLGKLPISANLWTILTFIPAIITFYFLAMQNFIPAFVFVLLTAVFDMIDGAVARYKGIESDIGAYIDTVTDRYIEFIVIAGLLFAGLPSVDIISVSIPAYVWIFVLIFGSMATTYNKAAAKEKDLIKDEIKGGILEKPDRMIALAIAILVAFWSVQISIYIIAIISALAFITSLQRFHIAMKKAKEIFVQ